MLQTQFIQLDITTCAVLEEEKDNDTLKYLSFINDLISRNFGFHQLLFFNADFLRKTYNYLS